MARPVPWEHWSARDARRHQTSAERRWENRSGSGRVRDELLRRSAARWPDREAALRVDGDEWETHGALPRKEKRHAERTRFTARQRDDRGLWLRDDADRPSRRRCDREMGRRLVLREPEAGCRYPQ